MRFYLLGALSLALAACGQSQQAASDGACALNATHEITWSNPAAADTVTATATGPTCAQAVVTLVVRDVEGDPLFAFASTYAEMSTGGRADADLDVEQANVQTFLDSWADVTMNTSGELPAWAEGAEGPRGVDEVPYYSTFLDRDFYETLRERNLPQLCFAEGIETSTCIVIDQESNRPLTIVTFGV